MNNGAKGIGHGALRKAKRSVGITNHPRREHGVSLVVRPHADNFNDVAVFNYLIDETVLDINPARVCSSQVANKLFEPWWGLKWVCFEYFEEFFCLVFQSGSCKLPGVFIGIFGVNKSPFHQESSVEHFSTGVFSPRTIFSRILGIDKRYNVSWIASQSSIETRTPALFLPTMWIGSWDFSDSDRSAEIFAFFASTVFMLLSPHLALRYWFSCGSSMPRRPTKHRSNYFKPVRRRGAMGHSVEALGYE